MADGESRCMGELKQLMPFGDNVLLEHVIGNLLESRVNEIIVVLGYQAEKIAPQIASKPIKIVLNPDFQQGMSFSIKYGVNHVSKTSGAIY